MAFSRERAFQTWILKLKYRESRFEALGMMNQFERLKRRRLVEVKDHVLPTSS